MGEEISLKSKNQKIALNAMIFLYDGWTVVLLVKIDEKVRLYRVNQQPSDFSGLQKQSLAFTQSTCSL